MSDTTDTTIEAVDMTALWRDDATADELDAVYQHLVDTGQAWQLEGSVGRAAMDMIEDGRIMLGESGHRDYYGNYIPSRHEVQAGTKGSAEFVEQRRAEREDEDYR